MFFHMAEYCDTLQSKEERNREHKACLNERTILRLLDHDVTWKSGCFPVLERGDFSKNSDVLKLLGRVLFVLTCGLMGLVQDILAMKGRIYQSVPQAPPKVYSHQLNSKVCGGN